MILNPIELSDLERFDKMMAEYAAEQIWWRTQSPGTVWRKCGLVLMTLFLVSILLPLGAPSHHVIVGGTLAVAGFGVMVAGAMQRNHVQGDQLRLLIEQTQETQLIRPLVSLASGSNRDFRDSFRSVARSGLVRLLPLIQPEDARRLGPTQWKWLHSQLRGTDGALMTAILQAILHHGTLSALPYVEPLAQGKGIAKRDSDLQHLAQSCVQKFQEQVDRLNMPHDLLRASEVPHLQELLRPAVEETESAPQQLLRASDKQNDERSASM